VTVDEAVDLLSGQEVIPLMQGTMAYVVELREKCLGEEIPVVVDRPKTRGKS